METDPAAVGPHNWSGARDAVVRLAQLSRRYAADRFDAATDGRLVVDVGGVGPIGDVSWRTVQWGPSAESACYSIGIALLPEHRGRGYGTEAQRLLVRRLFGHSRVARIQADTALDNVAEQRALAKVGFVREGVVRAAEWRDGRLHDHALYSVVRDEWNEVETL